VIEVFKRVVEITTKGFWNLRSDLKIICPEALLENIERQIYARLLESFKTKVACPVYTFVEENDQYFIAVNVGDVVFDKIYLKPFYDEECKMSLFVLKDTE